MTGLLLGQLLLTLVVAVFGIDPIPPQKFVHPPTCDITKPTSCQYIATWELLPTGMLFTIDAKQPGRSFTGIGLSKDKTTKRLDLMIGGFWDKKSFVKHGLSQNGQKLVEYKPKELVGSPVRMGDRIHFRFIHPLHPTDKRDFSFTDDACYYFYYLVQNNKFKDNKGSMNLKALLKQGIFSKQLICVKDLQRVSTPVATTLAPTSAPRTASNIEDGSVYMPAGEWESPSGDYRASWRVDDVEKVVKFHVESKKGAQNTAAAIGFTVESPMSDEGDLVYGLKDKSGKELISHGKIYAESDDFDQYDNLDLQNQKVVLEGGYMKLDFDHKLKPTTDSDVCFMEICYHFIYYVGGLPLTDDNRIVLPDNQPQYSEKRICVVRQETPLPSVSPFQLLVLDDPQNESMWAYPSGCMDLSEGCDYIARWERDETEDGVRFTVEFRKNESTTYFGIGFSKDQEKLDGSDVVYAAKISEDGSLDVHHGHFVDDSKPPTNYPSNDDLVRHEARTEGQRLILSFIHKRQPSDQQDFSFNEGDCYHFVFTYSGGNVAESGELLGLKPFYITKEKICIRSDKTEITTSPEEESSDAKRVCYYANWAQDREGEARFTPENIDPSLCSHIIFAYATLEDNRLAPTQTNDKTVGEVKGLYERINNLKKRKRSLKTLLAVGSFNIDNKLWTEMLSKKENRDVFVKTSIEYLRNNSFDGLDLMFEYPAARGSIPEDKDRFLSLIKELRAAFKKESSETGKPELLLTADVSTLKEVIMPGYNVKEMAANLDFINLLSYDLHGDWEETTGHNSPLTSSDELSVQWGAEYWVSQGAPKEKLVIGMPTYGRGFVLKDSNNNGLGAPAQDPSPAGQYTREPGMLAYYEICEYIKDPLTKVFKIEQQKVPYLVRGNVWIGYDDRDSLREKVLFVKNNGYAGYNVWISDCDDFTGTFCQQGRYPLIRTMSDTLRSKVSTKTPLPIILGSSTTLKPVTGSTTREITTPSTRVSTTTVTTTTTTTVEPCLDTPNRRQPHPIDCKKYKIQCSKTNAIVKDCPAKNTYYNPVTKDCTTKDKLTKERRRDCGL